MNNRLATSAARERRDWIYGAFVVCIAVSYRSTSEHGRNMRNVRIDAVRNDKERLEAEAFEVPLRQTERIRSAECFIWAGR